MATKAPATILDLHYHDRQRVGDLAAFAVAVLSAQVGPDPDTGAPGEGCCPYCCPGCYVLVDAFESGVLDLYLMQAEGGQLDTKEWDLDRDRLSRAFLYEAWRRANTRGCHDNEEINEIVNLITSRLFFEMQLED